MYLDENGLAKFTSNIKAYLQNKLHNTEFFITLSSPNSFTLETYSNSKCWDGTIEYSTDKTTWTTWNGETISSSLDGKLYLRGTQNTYLTNSGTDKFIITGSDVSMSGNIENLLDYPSVELGNHPPVATFCYENMFALSTALIDVSELKISYNTGNWCCAGMFIGCQNLVYPAENTGIFADVGAYYGMYANCTSLVRPVKLVETTISDGSFEAMYAGCVNLEKLPKFKNIKLEEDCYREMFASCTKIKVSQTQTGEYTNEFVVSGIDDYGGYVAFTENMLYDTGGTFTGDPVINTTYYTSNEVIE